MDNFLMQMDHEEDDLLIESLHLQVPQHRPDRVVSGSFPDNSFFGSSKVLTCCSRSLPNMSGSLQTQFVHRHVPKGRLHGTLSVHVPNHRERLSATNANTLIFGDNPQGRRLQRLQRENEALVDFDMLEEEQDGRHYEIVIPYLEPVLYASWMVPLNVSALKLLEQMAVFETDEEVLQRMVSISCTTYFLSLFMESLPAILFMEFNRNYTLTSFFYNHHVAAFEGLLTSQAINFALGYLKVAAEIRLGSLMATFCLTYAARHVLRRRQSVSNVTWSLGQYFLLIAIY